MTYSPDFGSGKTYPEHSAPQKEKTFSKYYRAYAKSKTKEPTYLCLQTESGIPVEWLTETDSKSLGRPLMLNSWEYLNDVEESSLSQILTATVPKKYYLSPKSCVGILNRSEKYGKTIPEPLKSVLQRQAGLSKESDAFSHTDNPSVLSVQPNRCETKIRTPDSLLGSTEIRYGGEPDSYRLFYEVDYRFTVKEVNCFAPLTASGGSCGWF